MQNHKSISLCTLFFLSLPALLFLVTLLGLAFQIFTLTGRIVYPIDDPYIHLAMARHWAQDGFFGVSLYGYSASSSSPGWTLLLGVLFYLFGNHEWLPLALNILAGLGVLVFLTQWFQRYIQHSAAAAISLIFLIFIIPLPAVALLGMEHSFHILFVLLLVHRAVNLMQSHRANSFDIYLFLWTLLATACRFETIFVVAPLLVLFGIRWAWKPCCALLLGSVGEIALVGAVQIANGWYFLPNAILQKTILAMSGWQKIEQTLDRWFGQLFHTAHIFTPYVLLLFAWLQSIRAGNAFTSVKGQLAFVGLGSIFLHCGFASLGWFYRYEAYLIAISAFALAPWANEIKNVLKALWWYFGNAYERGLCRSVCLLGIGLLPLLFSANLFSIQKIVPGARNLYQQQYQMGLFLNNYYEGEIVAANDIGAINYLADIYCLDLMGLGSLTPLRARIHQRYNKETIAAWCSQQNAKIAIVYQSRFRSKLPEGWIKAGEWTVPEKVTVADQTVSFYAVDPAEMNSLLQHLREFRLKLPEEVEVNLAHWKLGSK